MPSSFLLILLISLLATQILGFPKPTSIIEERNSSTTVEAPFPLFTLLYSPAPAPLVEALDPNCTNQTCGTYKDIQSGGAEFESGEGTENGMEGGAAGVQKSESVEERGEERGGKYGDEGEDEEEGDGKLRYRRGNLGIPVRIRNRRTASRITRRSIPSEHRIDTRSSNSHPNSPRNLANDHVGDEHLPHSHSSINISPSPPTKRASTIPPALKPWCHVGKPCRVYPVKDGSGRYVLEDGKLIGPDGKLITTLDLYLLRGCPGKPSCKGTIFKDGSALLENGDLVNPDGTLRAKLDVWSGKGWKHE